MDNLEAVRIKAAAELEVRRRQREKMKSSLKDFLIQDGAGRYQVPNHLEYLIKKLEKFVEDVENKRSPRLIISMPPRHSKSETTTKKLPAWVLGNHPDWEIIIASYSADLAEKFSRICRQTFETHEKVFGVKISSESASVKEWGIQGHRGALAATGVGGSATGKGAHIAIIDDPFKNREDADSDLKRERVREWYQSTLYTRLSPGGGIIVVQTRWHDDDLAGFLMREMAENDGEHFEILNFPAIAEEEDILGRKPGEALWPERYPLDALDKIKKAVGTKEWSALYQQRPSVQGGEIFRSEYFKYCKMVGDSYIRYVDDAGTERKVLLDDCLIFQTIDTALKINQKNDSTAIGTWAVDKQANLFMLDLFLDKIEVPDQWPKIKELKNRWNPHFQACEDKQSGTGLIQQSKREGCPLKPLEARGDKVTRSVPFSIMLENRKVYFNSGMSKLYELEQQLLKFPNAAHDDAVDVCSYAGILVQKGSYGRGGVGISMNAPVLSF